MLRRPTSLPRRPNHCCVYRITAASTNTLSAASLLVRQVAEYVGWLRLERRRSMLASGGTNGGTSGGPWGAAPRFDFALAAELAGFAFETYNEPSGARWALPTPTTHCELVYPRWPLHFEACNARR